MVFSELVSRNTRYSSRVLISLSLSMLFSHYFSINLANFEVFGILFERWQIESILIALLMASFLIHLVNWIGDFLGLRNWVVGLKETEVQIFWGGRTPLVSKLKLYLEDWENLKENFTTENMETFERQLEDLRKETNRLRSSVLTFISYSWFYVVIWMLVLPALLSVWAICLVYYA
jgi:uncharacterized membrane protein